MENGPQKQNIKHQPPKPSGQTVEIVDDNSHSLEDDRLPEYSHRLFRSKEGGSDVLLGFAFLSIAVYCLPRSIIGISGYTGSFNLNAVSLFDIAVLSFGLIFAIASIIKLIMGIKQTKIYIRNAPSNERRAIRQMLAINIICMVVFLSVVIYVCTYELTR